MEHSEQRKPAETAKENVESRPTTVSRRDFLKMAGAAGAVVGLGGGLGVALSGCGGETTTTSAAATTTSAAASTTTVSAVDSFDGMVDGLYAEYTTLAEVSLPDEVKNSPKAVTGKKLIAVPVIVACDTCSMWADTMKETSEMLGWNCTVIDPQGDPTKISNALDQAISTKADGVATFVVDASTLQEPFRRLREAGIPATSFAGGDTEEHLYISEASLTGGFQREGYLAGAVGYKLAGGTMKILACNYTGQVAHLLREEGFTKFVNEAKAAGKDCEILDRIETTMASQQTDLPGKAVSIVRKYPDYNVFWFMYDGAAIHANGGLVQSGLSDDSKIWVSHDATSSFIEQIKKGTAFKASMGSPIRWGVYGQQNDLNRKFAGLEPLGGDVVTYPGRFIMKDSAPEAGQSWEDYMHPQLQEAYKAIWVG